MPAGVVVAFDEGRGLGTIRSDGTEYAFHCTQLADGSRRVPIGQAVTFAVVPGRLGNWEAAAIEKVEGA
jgi:CspA family cold shock protein